MHPVLEVRTQVQLPAARNPGVGEEGDAQLTPSTFPESNFTFVKPPDMTEDQCGDLQVVRTRNSDQLPILVSSWRASWRERFSILFRGRVWLTVVGTRQPPVLLSASLAEARR